MNTLDSLKKRDLLAAPKFNPADMREYAEDYFAQERYGEAFAFFRKAADKPGVARVKAKAVELGDPELLWQIEHSDRDGVSREDWQACAANAEKAGKFRSAHYCFQRLGDAEKASALEAQFTAPTSPASPPQ